VGKGKRPDDYLEVRKRRGGIYFLNETSACEFYIRYIFTITCHQFINNFTLKYFTHMYRFNGYLLMSVGVLCLQFFCNAIVICKGLH
jgi:hypothetical protein